MTSAASRARRSASRPLLTSPSASRTNNGSKGLWCVFINSRSCAYGFNNFHENDGSSQSADQVQGGDLLPDVKGREPPQDQAKAQCHRGQ